MHSPPLSQLAHFVGTIPAVIIASRLYCTTLHCTAIHCNKLHYTALKYTAENCTPIAFLTIRVSGSLPVCKIHYKQPPNPKQHCTALHCRLGPSRVRHTWATGRHLWLLKQHQKMGQPDLSQSPGGKNVTLFTC